LGDAAVAGGCEPEAAGPWVGSVCELQAARRTVTNAALNPALRE
jgi:hypothetical protein